MTITTREAVWAAYARAFAQNNDHDAAAHAAAHELALPVEAVAECVLEVAE